MDGGVDDPITVEFFLTKQELTRATWYLTLRSTPVLVSGVLAVVCAVAGLLLRVVFLAIYGLVLLGFLGVTLPARVSKLWKRVASMPMHQSYNGDGFYVREGPTETRSTWDLFKQVHESPTLFLLLHAHKRAAIIVPKRAFRSPEDLERFRRLVADRIRPR